MANTIENLVQKAAERQKRDIGLFADSIWSKAFELAATKVETAAIECQKNVEHEASVGRLENARKYDIVREEFRRMAAELRRMKVEAPDDRNG